MQLISFGRFASTAFLRNLIAFNGGSYSKTGFMATIYPQYCSMAANKYICPADEFSGQCYYEGYCVSWGEGAFQNEVHTSGGDVTCSSQVTGARLQSGNANTNWER